MKKVLPGILLLLALCAFAPLLAAGNSHPAMLTHREGPVEVKRAGQTKWAKATLMALLGPGDALRAGKDANAVVVFFHDGHREKLLPDTTATVRPTLLQPVGGSRVHAPDNGKPSRAAGGVVVFKGGQKLTALGQSAAGRYGAVGIRDLGYPTLLSPLAPKIRTDRPLFAWTAVAGADTYLLRVMEEDGELLFERQWPRTHLQFPPDVAAVKPQVRYIWSVEARAEGKTLARRQGEFVLLAPASIRQLEREEEAVRRLPPAAPGETTGPILLARLYARYGLTNEAIGALESAVALNPNDAGIHEELGHLYQYAGRSIDARRHLARAEELADQSPAP